MSLIKIHLFCFRQIIPNYGIFSPLMAAGPSPFPAAEKDHAEELRRDHEHLKKIYNSE